MKHEAIDQLRYQGLGYRRIAAMLGMPEGTVKSYCRRHPFDIKQKVCFECGTPIQNTPHKRDAQNNPLQFYYNFVTKSSIFCNNPRRTAKIIAEPGPPDPAGTRPACQPWACLPPWR